jgi:hypothetical protein
MILRRSLLSALPLLGVLALGCSSPAGGENAKAGGPAKGAAPEAHEGDHKDGHGDHAGHSAAAPGDHAHESSHGGMVVTSGDKHLELKISPAGHVDVFVLDGEAKPASAAL